MLLWILQSQSGFLRLRLVDKLFHIRDRRLKGRLVLREGRNRCLQTFFLLRENLNPVLQVSFPFCDILVLLRGCRLPRLNAISLNLQQHASAAGARRQAVERRGRSPARPLPAGARPGRRAVRLARRPMLGLTQLSDYLTFFGRLK